MNGNGPKKSYVTVHGFKFEFSDNIYLNSNTNPTFEYRWQFYIN